MDETDRVFLTFALMSASLRPLPLKPPLGKAHAFPVNAAWSLFLHVYICVRVCLCRHTPTNRRARDHPRACMAVTVRVRTKAAVLRFNIAETATIRKLKDMVVLCEWHWSLRSTPAS